MLTLTGKGIARTVTINGNGHAINFGQYALDFQDANQSGSAGGWDLIFKDLTINANSLKAYAINNNYNPDSSSFAPFNFVDVSAKNQANDTVTFDGVTANVTDRGVINGHKNNRAGSSTIDGEKYTLVLKGTNNLTSNAYTGGATPGDDGNAISAGYVTVADGTTTINMPRTSSYNLQYGGAAVRTAQPDAEGKYSVDIKNGATLDITGGKDVKGIVTANATTGTVNVDGHLKMNMGAGHSIAMLAGNLNVGETGNVDITTAQVQTGGKSIANFDSGQYGVLSIGVGYPANETNQNANTITDNGTIKIVRTSTANSYSPMISMGSGSSALQKGTFVVNVNPGATLDLQDSEDQTRLGMIYVSGSSAAAYVNFNNPGYVNLQRLNALPENGSDLIYLEGGGSTPMRKDYGNGVTITNSPIAQWDEGNMESTPSFTWIVNSVNSMNNWGDHAGTGFTQAGAKDAQGKDGDMKFLHSNGSVIMAPSQSGLDSFQYNGSQNVANDKKSYRGVIAQGTASDGADYYTPYLNQFLNHFNYWTPQRLAMGSKLINNPEVVTEADKYQPETQTINGYTDQTLNDLNPNDGIKDYLESNGKTTNTVDKTTVNPKSVTWYNASADADKWNELMAGQAQPTNPTGNLKTTDTSAWAKVTYQDGSVDFVNIPLNIRTQADEYDPNGQNVNTTVGKEPAAKDGISNVADLPSDASYGWETTPDVSKPGVVPSIVKVTYDDGSQDQVPVNVIVKDNDGNVPTKTGDDAATNDPQGKEVTTTIGNMPNAKDAVAWPKAPVDGNGNAIDPSQIKYDWSTEPDIWTKGEHPGVVKVTYPDGSSDLVTTTVDVTNEPTGKDQTVRQGGTLPDPSTVINWGDGTQPTDPNVKYEWTNTPDTNTPGTKTGTVTITYPNGEKTTVKVPVHVTPSETTQGAYDPYAKNLNLPYSPTGDGVPEAGSVVVLPNGETAPAGVTYTWGTKPDTTKPGDQNATVVATYQDANGQTVTKNIPVNVHVGPMADYYKPSATDLTVPYGADMNSYPAKNQISGIPADVQKDDRWAPMPVTIVSGTQPSMIKVIYTDGSFDYAPLNVTVLPKNTTQDADTYQPAYDPMNVKQGDTKSEDPSYPETTPQGSTTTINPGGKAPAGTKYALGDGDHGFASIDPDKGTLTIAPTKDNSKTGLQTVPVVVTYPDNTTDKVNVPVYIGDDNHTGTITTDPTDPTKATGAYEVVTAPSNLKAHETSDHSMVLNAGDAVSAINHYKIAADGTITSTPVEKSAATVAWKGDQPTTTVTTPSASEDLKGTVSVTVDGTTVDSNEMKIPAAGATAKDVASPVQVTEGQDLTAEQAQQLVDTSALDNAGIKYTASWKTAPKVGDTQATVCLTFTDKDANGNFTYLDVPTKAGSINVIPADTDAAKYQPVYAPVEVAPGETKTATPTWSTENGNQGQPADGNATFDKTANTPAWATVATDGTVTLKPGNDVKPGDYLIPVEVTYKDGTKEVVDVPVVVKGASQHDNTVTYYGQNQTTSLTVAEYTTHKTSDGTVTDIPAPKVVKIVFKNQDSKWNVLSSVTYELKGDKYVATTSIFNPDGSHIQLLNGNYAPESFDASDISTQWMEGFEPNTNVDNYQSDGTKDGKGSGTGSSLASTQYAQAPNGDQRTKSGNLAGNSKTRVIITLKGAALSDLGGNGNWSNAFGNIYGANTSDPLTFKQHQDISNLTQDQYRHLIDVTDLGQNGWNGQDINPNAPQVLVYVPGTDATKQFSMTWAPNGQPSTAQVANGVPGTVRITFSDGTYLDVPATINVVADPDSGKTDQDKTEFSQKIVYTYNGKEVATISINNIKKGSDVSADTLKSTIDSNVPDNYTIASNFTYPAGLTNITATPAEIDVPLALKPGENFNVTGKMVYQLADGTKVADGPQIKSNKGDTLTAALLKDLADKNVPAGYEIVTYPASFNVTADNFTIPVTVQKTVPYNPSDKRMNKEVVRTITIYKTDGTTQTVTQTVHFVRGGEGQNAGTQDKDGNITWADWTVATKDGDSWKSTGAKTGAWAEYDVDQVNGYKSTVDGKEATKVDANNNITADTANANVIVAYTQTKQPTDPSINPTNPGKDSDMFAHPTRTINVTDPNTGAINTTKQTVWFGRTKTVSTDPKVGTTYGEWQLGKVENNKFVVDSDAKSAWPEFTTPEIAGFTPSQAKVDALNVTPTTDDETVNITYTKTDNGDHKTPTDNGDHGNTGDNGNHGNGNGTNNGGNSMNNGNNTATNDHAKNAKKALPQTGNDNSAAVAGLGLAGLTTMLGLAGLKKRKND